MNIYGYIRVSTKEQCEDRQVIAMQEYGVPAEHVFMDKQSGKDFDRQQYKRLLRKLRSGDVLVVKSIDRLGRTYEEILNQWQYITKERQATVVVLDMPLLNTSQDRDLTQTLISDIVLQLLSYVAETERTFIRQRQAEGIAAAKARGVKFGNRPLPTPSNFPALKAAYIAGEITGRVAASKLGVSHTTFCRWCKER